MKKMKNKNLIVYWLAQKSIKPLSVKGFDSFCANSAISNKHFFYQNKQQTNEESEIHPQKRLFVRI